MFCGSNYSLCLPRNFPWLVFRCTSLHTFVGSIFSHPKSSKLHRSFPLFAVSNGAAVSEKLETKVEKSSPSKEHPKLSVSHVQKSPRFAATLQQFSAWKESDHSLATPLEDSAPFREQPRSGPPWVTCRCVALALSEGGSWFWSEINRSPDFANTLIA